MKSKLAIVSTVKAPFEVLTRFASHHVRQVDKIWLFFDDPCDASMSYFADIEQINVIACDDDYWATFGGRPNSIEVRQEINATQALHACRSFGFDWLIHIDSDELLFEYKQTLRQLLTEAAADIVRFDIREAAVDRLEYDHLFCPTWFKVPSSSTQCKWAERLGCRHAIYQHEYFRGHLASKIAVRVNGAVSEMGIHNPKQVSAHAIEHKTADVLLLHYDCVGFRTWQNKWAGRISGEAKALRMRSNRKQQLVDFEQSVLQGHSSLERLYRSMYVVSGYEKIVLWLLGMICVIRLDVRNFDNALSLPKIKEVS